MIFAPVNPYQLFTPEDQWITVPPGEIRSMRTGAKSSGADIVAAARTYRVVSLGEQHATAAHQSLMAEIIRGLASDGRTVTVGLEMLTRPKQPVLNAWFAGLLSEDEFLRDVDWKGQWGFDYAFYRPILDAGRELRLQMVALNVPRTWVRSVGRGGMAALTPAQRAELGGDFAPYDRHRKVFEALLGGHPVTGASGENMVAAQTLWDEAMADSMLKALGPTPPAERIGVVVAGAGHVMYGTGINYRLARRTGWRSLNVVMIESADPVKVSPAIADYVFVSTPAPK